MKRKSTLKRKSKAINRAKRPNRAMARRGGRRRRIGRSARRSYSRARSIGRSYSRGRGKFGNFLKKGLLGDTTQALGAGLVVGAVADRVAPQFSPYVQIGAEYLVGGVGGMVGAEAVKMITGQPSVLGGLLGGVIGGQNNSASGGGML